MTQILILILGIPKKKILSSKLKVQVTGENVSFNDAIFNSIDFYYLKEWRCSHIK